MSTIAIVMMILILGLVWGGFCTCLYLALRNEKQKGFGSKESPR